MKTAIKNNISGLHHIAIRAKDFDRTLKFYVEAMGFSLAHSWSLPAFNLTRAVMLESADGHSYIELYDEAADIPAQGRKRLPEEEFIQTALLHICMRVNDCEAAYFQAINGGAKPFIEPMVLNLGNPVVTVRNSLVYSPNGEVIEFLEQTTVF